MAPFEALYGKKCRTPLNWSETGEGKLFGPDTLREAEEQVQLIRERLKTTSPDKRVTQTQSVVMSLSVSEILSIFG